MRRRSWFALALALILIALPASAYRREYNVTLEGTRKAGSEVCFYDARATANAFDLYFTYRRAACLPADKVLDMPRGIFHAFARHSDGYVSGHPDFSVSTVDAAEQGYQFLEVPLEPAGIADLSDVALQKGEKAGVWLAPSIASGGTFFPLIDGETTVMVPAGRTIVPLVISNGAPARAGEPFELRAGESRKAVFRNAANGTTTVVAWIRVDREEEAPLAEMPPPKVAAVSGDVSIEPIAGTTSGFMTTHTLVFFPGVPLGDIELQTSGRFWAQSQRQASVSNAPVSNIRDPILLLPASALTVSWDLGAEPAKDDPCSVPAAPRGRPMVAVYVDRCSQGGPDQQDACTPVSRHTEPFTPRQSVAFDGLLPGRYRVRVVPPATRAVSLPVELDVGRESSVTAPLPTFRLYGTVRLNGKPLQARLAFSTGEATSDTLGRYTAVLTAAPGANVVLIDPCAGGGSRITYRPDTAAAENSAFDIELRTLRFTATVLDPQQRPVSGASVNFAALHVADGGVQYHSEPVLTDSEGRAIFAHAPAGKTLSVCAEHAAHQRVCSAAQSVADVAARGVTLRFEPIATRGRVVGHAGRGLLAWVDTAGSIREQTSLADDGRFAFRQRHPAQSYLVYASTARPLTVLVPPANSSSDPELVITLPNAPIRSFTVVAREATRDGFIGVWVGGRYIPLDLLAFHHDHRGVDIVAHSNNPVHVRDIAETGPIIVAYAPEDAVPGPFVDPFIRPEYRNVERYPVTGASVVIP